MFYETLKLAVQAIRRNALRSFLTLLGIVIGVSAVIAMVTMRTPRIPKCEEWSSLPTSVVFESGAPSWAPRAPHPCAGPRCRP